MKAGSSVEDVQVGGVSCAKRSCSGGYVCRGVYLQAFELGAIAVASTCLVVERCSSCEFTCANHNVTNRSVVGHPRVGLSFD
jgi:hypothetical protein